MDDTTPDKAPASFTTSSGREIKFVPGYFEYIAKSVGLPKKAAFDYEIASANVAGGVQQLNYDDATKLNESVTRLPLLAYSVRYANT